MKDFIQFLLLITVVVIFWILLINNNPLCFVAFMGIFASIGWMCASESDSDGNIKV
jgi:hypothetical protein